MLLDVMDKVPKFSRLGASSGNILLYFVYKTPEMFGDSLPFAVLMTTLLFLGVLAKNGEYTALRSCGLSVVKITSPLLVLGVLSSLLLLVNAELIVPKSYQRMEYVSKVLIEKWNNVAVFRVQRIWFRSSNLILQAESYDPQHMELKSVVVWGLDASMNPQTRLEAEKATPYTGGWTLHNGNKRGFESNGRTIDFDAHKIQIALRPDDLKVLDKRSGNLSYHELREYSNSLERGGQVVSRYRTMMHAKIASPLSAFVMVVLGIPFALKTGRSANIATGIGIGVSIGFAYFIVNAAVQSYGVSGVLPPFIAAWGANVIFVLAGVWLSMTVKQQ